MLAFSQHNNIKGCVNMPEVAVRQQIEQHNAYKVEKAFEHYSYFVSSYYGFPWTQVKSYHGHFEISQTIYFNIILFLLYTCLIFF